MQGKQNNVHWGVDDTGFGVLVTMFGIFSKWNNIQQSRVPANTISPSRGRGGRCSWTDRPDGNFIIGRQMSPLRSLVQNPDSFPRVCIMLKREAHGSVFATTTNVSVA